MASSIAHLLDDFFAPSRTFDERCAIVVEPTNLDAMTAWLARIIPAAATPPSPRTVFALMMISADAGTMLSKAPVDYVMRDVAAQFCDSLRDAARGDAPHNFGETLRRCHGLLLAWRKRDAPLTLKFLLDDVVLAKSDGRSAEEVERLFDQIRSIGGLEAEAAARRRHDRDWESVQPADLEARLAEAMRRAFWDGMKEECAADPPSFERLFATLQELKDAVKALVAHAPRQQAKIDEGLDVAWLKQQADNGVLSVALIHQCMRFTGDTIISYKAAADTPEAIAWGQRLLADTADNARPFAEVLPVLIDFMRDAFVHVEQIYGRILALTREEREKAQATASADPAS